MTTKHTIKEDANQVAKSIVDLVTQGVQQPKPKKKRKDTKKKEG